MSGQMDDLQTLLEQLKAATADNPPYKGFSDDEKALMDQIRAYGEVAIEPLIAFLAQLMADTEETAALDTGDDELTYYYADTHITDILCDLPLTEDHVRRLLTLLEDYPDNDWYHTHLVQSLGKRGEAVIEPTLEILRDRTIDYLHRNTAAEILENAIKAFPDQRERVADELVAIMSAVQRKQERDHDRVVNAFMLSTLGETRQEQYIPFIKKMFKSRRVDDSVTDLDWVLDSIQGIDPMARHADSAIPDWFLRDVGLLKEYAKSMGIEDSDELLNLIASSEFSGDAEEDEALESIPLHNQPPYPRDYSEPMSPFHAKKLPGRNDPCWCGSGKKYKHCHWREDQQKRRSGS